MAPSDRRCTLQRPVISLEKGCTGNKRTASTSSLVARTARTVGFGLDRSLAVCLRGEREPWVVFGRDGRIIKR